MKFDTLMHNKGAHDEEHWISVSDLMAGLMVIFLFIAITYIRPILNERNTIREIAVTWQASEQALYERLYEEFKTDLPKWNAEIDRTTLSLRFKEPDILFDTGQASLKEPFKDILSDFYPRYMKLLQEFKDVIAEVRVEGHTSSEWAGTKDKDEAYFNNMRLSQERTRSVLKYCLQLDSAKQYKEWAQNYITANGLASSQLIYTDTGEEDPGTSRRVEFRVRTNAERQIIKIIEQSQ